MNKSAINEIVYKVFRSGNPLFLFLGINVIVFLVLNLIGIGEFLTRSTGISIWLLKHLSVPAHIAEVPYKFWTIITYMFTQKDFFHLLFNMLWLYWLGMIFMDFLNKRQFIFVYLAGGIAGAALYLLAYNLIPVFIDQRDNSLLLGSSASVMAIVFATATLVPDFSIRLLFLGNVKLKFLALAYLALSLLGVGSSNAGGSLAHLGGALLGFVFILQLRKGSDWSNLIKKRSKLKVVRKNPDPVRSSGPANQEEIDSILDKISHSGYDSLTASEKETLFKASSK